MKAMLRATTGIIAAAWISACNPLPAFGQLVLGIDFNHRGGSATMTMPDFEMFELDGTGAISTPTVRNFGNINVTVAPFGSGATMDSRQRTTPTDSGNFTQSLLLRDFLFCGSATTGTGLDITVDGLNSNQVYLVRIWSYDNTSTGNRVSDWSINGTLLRDNYVFNGSTLPTDDNTYVFTMKATATAEGRLLIQGRRDAATSSAGSVFVNAMQIELAPPDPPAIQSHPADTIIYAGEVAILRVSANGTAPMYYQWYSPNGAIPNATNTTLVLTYLPAGVHGPYSVIVSNQVGSDTSFEAIVQVQAVADINTALLAWWPLDALTDSTPDVSGNQNFLYPLNMTDTNVIPGQHGNAMAFDGTAAMLYREHATSTGLPAATQPAYSITLWVKGNYAGQSDRRVFSESSTVSQTPLLNIGTHNAASNGTVDIFIRQDSGSTPHNHRHSTQVAFDDTWHHIAWVDDRGFARLYLDGKLDRTDFTYTRSVLTPTVLTLGGILRTNASHWFAGAIDDAAVWGRALNAHEVQYAMLRGAEPYPAEVTNLRPELPADTPVNEGRSATLNCALYGQGISYQWYFNDQIIEGATDPALILNTALPANAGPYYVVASSSMNSVTSRVATLAVIPPPTNVMLAAESLLAPTPDSNTFGLTVPTIIGYTYALDFTEQLTQPASNIVWTPVAGAAVTGNGNPQSLSDTNALSPARYYRLRMVPIP